MAEGLPNRPTAGVHPERTPPPPDTLSEDAAAIWTAVVHGWHLHDDAFTLLRLGLESFDRYREAADILKNEGPVVRNPNSGAVRQHPAHAVARDNLTAVRQVFRQLGLQPPEAP